MKKVIHLPDLRFPEFQDTWSILKLSSKCDHITYGLTVRPNYHNIGVPLISAREIRKGYVDYENAPKISEFDYRALSDKCKPQIGDLFLSKTGTIGLTAIFNKEIRIAITQNIAVVRLKEVENDNATFLFQYFKTEDFHRTIMSKVNQSTIMDLQLRDIRKIKIPFPSLPEQKKIADFLSTVDKKIQALNKKKELLQSYKKGVMQKIFPTKGRQEPEIRFKQNDGSDYPNWDVLKMENICKINQGLQIAIAKRFSEDGENRHFYITNEFLKESSDKKYYIENPPESVQCTEDDILMTRTGNTGQVVTNVKGAFHNNFFKINYDRERVNKMFLLYFLRLYPTQCLILRLAGTSTIPDLNHGDFYRIPIVLPSVLEQTKIANFLTSIDDKINVVSSQIDKMKEWKKGLLQQMFV